MAFFYLNHTSSLFLTVKFLHLSIVNSIQKPIFLLVFYSLSIFLPLFIIAVFIYLFFFFFFSFFLL